MTSVTATPPAAYAVLGVALALDVFDAATWSLLHYAIWVGVIVLAMELLGVIVLAAGSAAGFDTPQARIRPGGPPLDVLSPTDIVFIAVNKVVTAAFTYQALRYLVRGGGASWGALTLANSGLALPLLFVAYDAVYTPFHAVLHHPAIYAFVHKHHHRQIAPFRGSTDAVNVHPFEFVIGEYNHLLSLVAVNSALAVTARLVGPSLPPAIVSTLGLTGAPVHAAAAALFIVGGGVLASLNHTRFDVAFGGGAFAVRYHDIHHHRLRFNYCQYTPLFDFLGGSFRRPDDDSAVDVAAAQASQSSAGEPGATQGRAAGGSKSKKDA